MPQPRDHETELLPLAMDDPYQREPELFTHRDEALGGFEDDHHDGSDDVPVAAAAGGGGNGGKPPLGPLARRKRKWRRVRRTIYVLAGLCIVLPVIGFFIAYQVVKVPSPAEVIAKQQQPVTYYWSNNQVMDRSDQGKQNRQILKPDQIPATVKHAAEAAEDATFEENNGFSATGILHALWKQVSGGSGGGSTISQQYIKKATGNDQHSYVRKAVELVKSVKLNNQTSKPEIMAGYLNIIYFGRGAYGIGAAAQAYFGTDVAHLTPERAAYLAGLIQGPSRSDDQTYVQNRWNYVMDQMVKHHWISAGERQSARIPVPVSGTSKETNYLKGKPYLHFIEDRVKNELASKGLNEDALRHDGAKIYLTIDPKAEQQAADASHKIMSHDKGAGQKYLDSSLVSADPKTGAIIAYYGGNWNISQLDMANHAHMPGSSFKPIDFASAMQQDRSIGIGTTYDGTPNQTIQGQHVNNAGNENCGKNCSVQRGMTQSVNTVFYNMVAQIHSPNVRKTAWQLGVPQQYYDNGCKKNMPTLTSIDHKACKPGIVGGGISIGGYPVAPRDMVQAYATLANGGNKMPLHFVSKVTDNTGQNVLYQSAESAKPVLDPQNPDHNKKIARNVTQSMLNVARYSGDALDGGRPVASKTGTAQYGMQGHNQAAWMIGYTPSVVTGVWVGNADRPSPIFGNYHNGKGPEHHYDIYGREEPAYIWKAFMDSYLKGTPNEQFSPFEPLGNSTVNDAVYSTNSGSTSDSSSNSGSSNNTSTQYSGSQSTPTTVPPTQPTHPTQPTAPPVTSQPAKPPPTTGGILPPVNNGRGNGNGGG